MGVRIFLREKRLQFAVIKPGNPLKKFGLDGDK